MDITEEIISKPEDIAIKTIKNMNQREIKDWKQINRTAVSYERIYEVHVCNYN